MKDQEGMKLLKDVMSGRVKITEEMREDWVESAMRKFMPKNWREIGKFRMKTNLGHGEGGMVTISRAELIKNYIRLSSVLKDGYECETACPGYMNCKRRGMTQCFRRGRDGSLEFTITLNCDKKVEHEARKRRAELFKNSKIPAKFRSSTFNDYILDNGNKEAYNLAITFRDNEEKKGKGLYLYGNKGVGKTMLVSILATAIMDKKSVVYYTATKLAIDIKSSIDLKTTGKLLGELEEVDVLIIDDLGTETQKAWLTEQFYDIFDTRYQNELPVIITSNLNPIELTRHFANQVQGERIVDRIIAQTQYVELKGLSKRMN